MTAPRTFPSTAVREAIRHLMLAHSDNFVTVACEMLDAFAARLEEDDRIRLNSLDPAMGALIDRAAERLREQGRREVLREVVAKEPHISIGTDATVFDSECFFCGAPYDGQAHHGPSCLWLRAQEAAKT